MLPRIEPLNRYTEAVERAQRHWHATHDAEPSLPKSHFLTVALSREAGAPGTSVAREVGRQLNWPVYDQELVELIAQEMGLRTSLLESVDEKQQGWLAETFASAAAVPQATEDSYVKHLVQTVVSLGAHGRCVIVGRGAAHILPAASTVRVRLQGDLPHRIAATEKRRGLTPKEAKRWVEQTDDQRRRFIQDHFQKDPTDLRLYDLVLNTSLWSGDECAGLIVQGVRALERRPG
jgi:cytidylate kinase